MAEPVQRRREPAFRRWLSDAMRPATLVYTVLALAAFAANSVLCRLALAGGAIDAASFSTIRLVAGAITLVALSSAREGHRDVARSGSWGSAVALFLYAVPFSFAYVTLSAGTGALILFGAVQATMIVAALRSGERPMPLEWAGWVMALAGLIYLVVPGLAAPTPVGSGLMGVAGVAWGIYSLRGRDPGAPVETTAGNFVRTVPLAAAMSLFMLGDAYVSVDGVLLASVSGALASGVGYVVWYAALTGLTAARAATVQLAVPVLAAAGGVLFLSETVTRRLVLSAVSILGGVALAVLRRGRRARASPGPLR